MQLISDLPTNAGIAMGFIPAVALLSYVKGRAPWEFISLFTGLTLVGLATFMLGMMSDLSILFEGLSQEGTIDQVAHDAATTDIQLWKIMFPAVVGSIGASYIAGWFQSSKPTNS